MMKRRRMELPKAMMKRYGQWIKKHGLNALKKLKTFNGDNKNFKTKKI